MKKMKLLTAVLFCLGVAGMAWAVTYEPEVISIDFNKQDDANAYSGTAAIEDVNTWRTYYGEKWGKAMGSQRTADLADYNEPNKASVYAAQVWIGVDANGATYDTYDGDLATVGLMDDGFEKTGGASNPGIRLWGRDAYGGDGGAGRRVGRSLF